MKIPKQINLKTALIFVLISIVLTSGLFYVFAATPTSTIYISSGIYPGAPSYTIWKEGSNYFAKDSHGENDYSGTNASEVIQNVFDASNVYSVYFKGAKYLITHTLTLPNYITIEGDGWQTEFEASGLNDVMFNVTLDTPSNTVKENLIFRDFWIDGQGTVTDAIYLRAWGCEISNVRIKNVTQNGVHIKGGINGAIENIIEDCIIEFCDNACIFIDENATDNEVLSNFLHDALYGVYFGWGSQGSRLESNHIYGNTYGIVSLSTMNHILGNYIESNDKNGIYLNSTAAHNSAPNNHLIGSNQFWGNGLTANNTYDDILINGQYASYNTTRITINDNQFLRSDSLIFVRHCINATDTDYLTVVANNWSLGYGTSAYNIPATPTNEIAHNVG